MKNRMSSGGNECGKREGPWKHWYEEDEGLVRRDRGKAFRGRDGIIEGGMGSWSQIGLGKGLLWNVENRRKKKPGLQKKATNRGSSSLIRGEKLFKP